VEGTAVSKLINFKASNNLDKKLTNQDVDPDMSIAERQKREKEIAAR
jgi:hypothetical protein